MKEPLFDRIRFGDKFAFELLYRKYFERMCIFAVKFLKNNELALEVVQDVFYNIWSNRTSLTAGNMYPSYLFTSVKNRSLNELNRQKKEGLYQEVIRVAYFEEEGVNEDDTLVAKEMEEKIASIIEGLPPKCRQIFMMSRYENKQNKEIAAELDISVKTVETHMSRALRVFRIELVEYMNSILFSFF